MHSRYNSCLSGACPDVYFLHKAKHKLLACGRRKQHFSATRAGHSTQGHHLEHHHDVKQAAPGRPLLQRQGRTVPGVSSAGRGTWGGSVSSPLCTCLSAPEHQSTDFRITEELQSVGGFPHQESRIRRIESIFQTGNLNNTKKNIRLESYYSKYRRLPFQRVSCTRQRRSRCVSEPPASF